MPAALNTLIYALLITSSFLIVSKVANSHNQEFGLIGTMHENCLFLRVNDFFGITDKRLLPKHGDFGELYEGGYFKNGSFVSINQLIVDISREDIREVAGYAPRRVKFYPCKE